MRRASAQLQADRREAILLAAQRCFARSGFHGASMQEICTEAQISPGGLYMNTHAEIPEGALLLVRIPFRADAQVVCNAVVVYSNPGRGVGLKFQGLSDEVKAVLEREVSK